MMSIICKHAPQPHAEGAGRDNVRRHMRSRTSRQPVGYTSPNNCVAGAAGTAAASSQL